MRALYFLLQNAVARFVYLKVGLGFVLAFVGVKMLVSEFYRIPITISLAVVGGILGVALLASLLRAPEAGEAEAGRADAGPLGREGVPPRRGLRPPRADGR